MATAPRTALLRVTSVVVPDGALWQCAWLAMRHRGVVKLDRRAVGLGMAGVAAGMGLRYWAGAVPGVVAALAA